MKNRRVFMLGVIVLLSLFAFWGCPKKAQVTTKPETAPAAKAEPTDEQKAAAAREEEARLAASGHKKSPGSVQQPQQQVCNPSTSILTGPLFVTTPVPR